ncbi:MAG: hypothetical protein ABF379_05525, partial [Akkermansiaceae bacterium]
WALSEVARRIWVYSKGDPGPRKPSTIAIKKFLDHGTDAAGYRALQGDCYPQIVKTSPNILMTTALNTLLKYQMPQRIPAIISLFLLTLFLFSFAHAQRVRRPAGKAYIYKEADEGKRELEVYFPKDSEIDFIQHLKPGAPPAIAFFGSKDKWLKGWNPTYAKWQTLEKSVIKMQIAEGQNHAFFNNQPWADLTLVAADEFLQTQGLLKGKSTLPKPPRGEKLNPVAK